MDQNVSTIGEKNFTLYVSNPTLAIKDQDSGMQPNIQNPSVRESNASQTTGNEKSSSTFKRINSLGYLVTVDEEVKPRKNTEDDDLIYHKSTSTCCKCNIF
mmetsp:Transcript_10202/g.10090  ORF Transcript_10202/g.10090 Transcript_10202/m.10090 type:complete len:101 (-) Transcript_10202:27-329(-)